MMNSTTQSFIDLTPQPSIQDYINVLYTTHDKAFTRLKNQSDKDDLLCDMIMDLKLVIQQFESMKRPNYYT